MPQATHLSTGNRYIINNLHNTSLSLRELDPGGNTAHAEAAPTAGAYKAVRSLITTMSSLGEDYNEYIFVSVNHKKVIYLAPAEAGYIEKIAW